MKTYVITLTNQAKTAKELGKDYVNLLLESIDAKLKSKTAFKIDGNFLYIPNAQPNTDSDFIFEILIKNDNYLKVSYYSAIG